MPNEYALSSIVEPHATSSRQKPSKIAWVKLNLRRQPKGFPCTTAPRCNYSIGTLSAGTLQYQKWESVSSRIHSLKTRLHSLLGGKTTQEIHLIQVHFENILSLDLTSEGKTLTKELLIAKFPDVFNGTGKLHGPYHLEIEPTEELTLQCDASQTRLGAVLTQNGPAPCICQQSLVRRRDQICPDREGAIICGPWVREIPSVHIWLKGYGTN